ncbi:MAG TPA: hypothetical protein VHM00_19205 [Caldimonas sp.]|jgi:hypothetical protein|nr:hypothetical protein [Caldimonas sp.]HEX2543198.1 hypothetical protein [Caldimonas sp.]
MSDSSSGGKFTSDNPGRRTGAAAPDEWPATRAEPASREEVDAWQATRILTDERGAGAAARPEPPHVNGSGQTLPSEAPRRGPRDSPDAWAATRAHTALATQMLPDENDYLAGAKDEIGRQIGGNERELFVSCAPGEALQQQFEHLQPEFIAVHDVATASSRKLLAGIAAASGRSVQKLVIRRQGYGTALATLEFVDLPTTDNQALRLYTTESDADTAARHAIAKTLLAYSRLGVVMVGELPGHAIAAALKPLHEDILAGPWPNRNLLLLPLASASTLVTHGLDLGRGTGVAVRTTPQVARPADAWAFITGTWSRLRENAPSGGRAVPELGSFKPAPYEAKRPPISSGMPSGDTMPMEDASLPMTLSMRPMPAIASPHYAAPMPSTLIERYVKQLSELNGVISCCVFELPGGEPVAHAGANPGSADLASHGSTLVAAMTTASRGLGFGAAIPEAAITLGSHHLLLRALPRNPGLAMHAVLDKTSANLTLARLQILRMDAMFDEPS